MKEPNRTSQSPLGYLFAFTLGIICMGALMFFLRPQPPQPSEPEIAAVDESIPPQPFRANQPNTRNTGPSRIPNSRAISSTLADDFPVHDVSTIDEAPPIADEPLDSNRSVPIAAINRQVTVAVADRHFDNAAPLENTRVSGRVTLFGPRPPERLIVMDPQCAAKHPGQVTTRFFLTGKDNGLADVLVVITAGLAQQAWPVPQEPVTLRLRNCIYENHVVAVQSGQQLLVANLDQGLHNVHPTPSVKGNPESNFAMLPNAPALKFNFSQPERFLRFKCDVHPWEFAYVNVIQHPFFAITDANGNFTIPGLPPGDYTLEAHHRKAGLLQKQITVHRHRNTTVNFQLTAAPQPAQQI